jgi:DNA-directed RNA polymerase beta' subunit
VHKNVNLKRSSILKKYAVSSPGVLLTKAKGGPYLWGRAPSYLRGTNLKNELKQSTEFKNLSTVRSTKEDRSIDSPVQKKYTISNGHNKIARPIYMGRGSGSSSGQRSYDFQKRLYTSYSKFTEVKLITIGIASPLRILQWAEKTLPNGKIYGEVLNANTLHHKTFKPQKGGLFCERIFGPLKDFECSCGKIDKTAKYSLRETDRKDLSKSNVTEDNLQPKKSLSELTFGLKTPPAGGEGDKISSVGEKKTKRKLRKFCPDCDVEYTWSVIRRYQLGYIKLISPVTHVWFLKGTPSYLSILLDIKKRHLQSITYCSETFTIEHSDSAASALQTYKTSGFDLDSPSKIYASWSKAKNAPQYISDGISISNVKNGTSATSPSQVHPNISRGGPDKGNSIPDRESIPIATFLDSKKKRINTIKNWRSSPINIGGAEGFAQGDININLLLKDNKLTPPPLYIGERGSIFSGEQRAPGRPVHQTQAPPKGEGSSKPVRAALKKTSKILNLLQKPIKVENSSHFMQQQNPVGSVISASSSIRFSILLARLWRNETRKELTQFLSILQLSLIYNELINSFFKENTFHLQSMLIQKTFSETHIHIHIHSLLNRDKVQPDEFDKSILSENTQLDVNKEFVQGTQPREEKGEGKLNSNNSYTHLTAVDRSKVGPSLIINNITKKSSINLYIKSSLQRMLHKKIVMNSIVKTWQNIYKKAYLKAMYKTLSYFLTHPKMEGTTQHITSNNLNLFFHYYKRNKIYASKTTIKYLKSIIKVVKIFFKKNVLLTIQNIKQPIFDLHFQNTKNYTLKTAQSSAESHIFRQGRGTPAALNPPMSIFYYTDIPIPYSIAQLMDKKAGEMTDFLSLDIFSLVDLLAENGFMASLVMGKIFQMTRHSRIVSLDSKKNISTAPLSEQGVVSSIGAPANNNSKSQSSQRPGALPFRGGPIYTSPPYLGGGGALLDSPKLRTDVLRRKKSALFLRNFVSDKKKEGHLSSEGPSFIQLNKSKFNYKLGLVIISKNLLIDMNKRLPLQVRRLNQPYFDLYTLNNGKYPIQKKGGENVFDINAFERNVPIDYLNAKVEFFPPYIYKGGKDSSFLEENSIEFSSIKDKFSVKTDDSKGHPPTIMGRAREGGKQTNTLSRQFESYSMREFLSPSMRKEVNDALIPLFIRGESPEFSNSKLGDSKSLNLRVSRRNFDRNFFDKEYKSGTLFEARAGALSPEGGGPSPPYLGGEGAQALKAAANVSYTQRKRLYNNVYTLSHRERWGSRVNEGKDWEIFLLYNTGAKPGGVTHLSSSNSKDQPIFAYKDRISSTAFHSQTYDKKSMVLAREAGKGRISPPEGGTNPTAELGRIWPPSPLGGAPPKGEGGVRPIPPNYDSNAALPFRGGSATFAQPNQTTSLSKKKTPSGALPFRGGAPYGVLINNSFFSGPGIVQQLLNELTFSEMKKLDKQNRLLLYILNKSIFRLKKHIKIFIYDKSSQIEMKELCKKRDLLIRRTKLVRKLFRKDSDPSSMILTVLPVLPPDLRPIVKMGGQIAASDLNRFYQRVIYRNDRLKKFLKDPATSHSYEMKYAQRLLQEAVDNLIQNGQSGGEKDSRGRALKSLSDILKGKQGRFRQFLLGKRVDYSGRSVIVVGPKLKLYECGIPLEMALELYLPFLLKTILNKNYAKTVVGAKALIKTNRPLALELLREIMQVSPVLLNRAPTLHRLGFQAFVPKLVEGRAILLHPLVCSSFNADFDGDQMAVHVPITIEARAEAWKLMLSRNNLLSPATGDPLSIPSQDMVLGCYYLTTNSNKGTLSFLRGSGLFFNDFQKVLYAYNLQKIDLHAIVWVKWAGLIENGNDQEEPLEIRLSSLGHWQELSYNYIRHFNPTSQLTQQYMSTTPGRILFHTLLHSI